MRTSTSYWLAVGGGLLIGAALLPAYTLFQSVLKPSDESLATTLPPIEELKSAPPVAKTISRTPAVKAIARSIRTLQNDWADAMMTLAQPAADFAAYEEADPSLASAASSVPATLPEDLDRPYDPIARREQLQANLEAHRARLAAVRKDAIYRAREERKAIAAAVAARSNLSAEAEAPTTPQAGQTYGPLSAATQAGLAAGASFDPNAAYGINGPVTGLTGAASTSSWSNTWDGYRLPVRVNQYSSFNSFNSSGFGYGGYGGGFGYFGGNGCSPCNSGCGPQVYYGGGSRQIPFTQRMVGQPYWFVKQKP